jgi:Domain of unknown function (DUF4832)/Domain of unknown function (DUF4874)/Secretion system C-terminal sorting domain
MKTKIIISVCFILYAQITFAQTNFTLRNDGTILKNNVPFFPMGFYVNRSANISEYEADVNSIANAGAFNFINLPYIEGNITNWTSFLNLCNTKNIYVSTQLNYVGNIYTPIDLYKNHPATYGWSIADDADVVGNGAFTPAQLIDRNNECKTRDPNHLTELSLTGYYPSRRAQANIYTPITDAPAYQIYPITPPSDYDVTPSNALIQTYLRTLLYVQSAALTNRPLIMNSQTFSWGAQSPNPRYPTAAEMRNMTYAGLAAGIKGIVSYAYSDDLANQTNLWNEIKLLRTDITVLEQALLNGLLTRVNTIDEELVCSYWKYNNEYYIAVINTSYANSKTINITIPNTNNFQAQPLFTRMPNTLSFSGNVLAGNIAATDVQVYKLSPNNNNGTITYNADNTTNIANPERGWHIQFETCADVNENLNESELIIQRTQNQITLVKKNYNLRLYKNAPLAQAFLDLLQSDLNKCRNAGVKLIPLFRYNACEGEPAPNAPFERIFEHMDQLATILTNNKDVIAWVKAGFIGAYGEWHDADDPTLLTMPKKGQILNKLLSILPIDRMVSLRYAKDKREIYNQIPLTLAEAHNGSNKARVGHENDSFGSNAIDYGTYYFGEGAGQAPDIELVKTYLEQENNFVPQGGETSGLCGLLEGDSIYHKCDYALLTMQRLKYTSISHYELFDVNAPCNTIPIWATGGCEPEMRRKLGYRFRLTEATIPSSVTIGNNLQMNLNIRNDGWANPINPRGVQIILRNKVTNEEFFVVLNNGNNSPANRTLDPRFWASNTTTTININNPLPNNIPVGEYDLFLHLFAPENSIKARPEYAIRLANNNVWESTTGYNSLLASITINGSVLALDNSTKTVSTTVKNKRIIIFPNPAKESTTVSYYLNKKSVVQISLFDATGRLVNPAISNKQEAGNHLQKINTNNIPSGIYFVHITLNGVQEIKKIIISK